MIKNIAPIIAIFISVFLFFSLPTIQASDNSHFPQLVEAQVEKINLNNKKREVEVRLLNGKFQGRRFRIIQSNQMHTYNLSYNISERVIVTLTQDSQGNIYAYISDYYRQPGLILLLGLFLVSVLLVGGRQGLMSLVGMMVSFSIIVQMLIPNILAGSDPFFVSLFSALFIVPIVFYLAHGVKRKTTIAVISSLSTLFLVALMAYLFTNLTRLTGFANEDALYLQLVQSGQLNVKSLFLAGLMVGVLAVLDDITISQAAVVESLLTANPYLSRLALWRLAMRVGRDHVASLVNTLILVYVGASLPLVLLFYDTITPFNLILNQEVIATEIVRTLVSSIGIILAVPITTYLAVIFCKRS